MSTTKRESLRQVQKSARHLVASTGLPSKRNKNSSPGHVVCLSHSRRQNILRETKTEDFKGTKILILQKIACALLPEDFSTRLFLRKQTKLHA